MPGKDTVSGSTPEPSITSGSPLTCRSASDSGSPDSDKSWQMFPRKWVTANDLGPDADPGMTFTLMTYNVLTDRCSQ